MENSILSKKIIECAAHFMHLSYGSISVKDAFEFAVGEAEAEFDTDLNIEFNEDIKTLIEEFI